MIRMLCFSCVERVMIPSCERIVGQQYYIIRRLLIVTVIRVKSLTNSTVSNFMWERGFTTIQLGLYVRKYGALTSKINVLRVKCEFIYHQIEHHADRLRCDWSALEFSPITRRNALVVKSNLMLLMYTYNRPSVCWNSHGEHTVNG